MRSQIQLVQGTLKEKILAGIAKNAFLTNQIEGNFYELGYISSVAHDEPVWQVCKQMRERFWHDVTGRPLDPKLVRIARAEEIEEVCRTNLYTKVPEQECYDKTGKAAISTRWVDINKGDDVNPECRSRIVGRELKHTTSTKTTSSQPPHR